MNIILHRGQHQIGGSIIEVSSETTRIFIDTGLCLDDFQNTEIPAVDGLFTGVKNCDAVFISHYHADHIGLVEKVLSGIPVYIGRKSFEIMLASCEYRQTKVGFTPQFFENEVRVQIGDITVTPYSCDHSAYDSYMFVVECCGIKILYTGDYRSNGRKEYSVLLSKLPEVYGLITEGTTLTRNTIHRNIEEVELENKAVEIINQYSGACFVILSAMNIDRLISLSNAAQRTNRIFLEDVYTAMNAAASEEKEVSPYLCNNIKVFQIDNDKRIHNILEEKFHDSKISRNAISKTDFVMCIRSSMLTYLKKLNNLRSFENGVLIYSIWSGYKERPNMKKFLDEMQKRGLKVITLHTSGHADPQTIDELINTVRPKVIIPVHTENAEWFDRYKKMCNVSYDKEVII